MTADPAVADVRRDRRGRHRVVQEDLDHRPGGRGHHVGDRLADVGVRPQEVAPVAVVPRIGPAPGGHRARLQDEQLRVGPAPLDVDRLLEDGLDPATEAGQPQRLRASTGWAVTQCSGTGARVVPPVGPDGHHGLGAGALLVTRPERRSIDEGVGGDVATDDRLAQSPGRVDRDRAVQAGDRVDGEHHPGRLRVDHPLHDDRDGDIGRGEALPGAIDQRARRPGGRPAPTDGVHQGGGVADVQEALLLPGERAGGQVLSGGRGPDRDPAVAERRVPSRIWLITLEGRSPASKPVVMMPDTRSAAAMSR